MRDRTDVGAHTERNGDVGDSQECACETKLSRNVEASGANGPLSCNVSNRDENRCRDGQAG